MRASQLLLTALLLLAAAAPAAADVTVYSSLPLQGASRPQAEAINAGARLAIQDAGGQAGGQPVRFIALDDSTRQAGTWAPERASANARRAAQDDTARGYLGEFNSGASAISMPILNEVGLLQVSPSNTALGLTRRGPGAERGEPDKYQPTGTRTFGRILPNDRIQALAAASLLRADGVRRVTVVSDGEVYGSGLARTVAAGARQRGIRVTVRRLGRRGRNATSIARAARRGDALFYGGITRNGAVRLWRAAHAAKRTLKLYGGDGIAESGFSERISRSAARRTKVMVATLAPSAYPPAGQQVLQRLGGNPDPYALYGYEAMGLILDSINRAGPGADRSAVVRAFFATRDRDSVLGRYSIDPNGDTTLTQYGVYGIDRGALVFAGVADVAG